VRTRSDGVHVQVNNSTDGSLVLNYTIDDGQGGGGDMVVPQGISEQVVPFVARAVGFRCLSEEDDDELMDFALSFETVKVVDPRGDAKSAQPLDCSSSPGTDEQSPSRVDRSVAGSDPVGVVRAYLRGRDLLEPDDTIEPAVSPGPEFPVVRLVREGRLVGAFWFSQLSPEGSEFTLDAVQLCPSIS
jgi:hypothetical protein